MLSDSDKIKDRPSNRRRGVAAKGKHYSDSQKIEAVTTWLALGDLRLTANVLKIGEPTLRVWKTKDWWLEIETELRQAEDIQMSVRLQRIIDKSFSQVEDRLANGDWIYDQKTGELKRKPVNMKDAHKVAVDLIDKRETLLGKTPKTVSADALDDKLLKLAEKFAQIAQQAKTPVQVTDVIEVEAKDINQEDDDEDAVYEEREEGLQEGERAVQLETRSDQTPE